MAEFIKLEYKNGIYQGQHNGYHKDGLGCFLSDDGLFYIGQWNRDSLHGLGLIFFPKNGFFYGFFEKNLLNGIGILKYGNNNMIVGNWKDSCYHGVIFKYNHSRNSWSIEEYENGNQKTKVSEKEFDKDSPDNDIPYFFSTYVELPRLYKDVINKTFLSEVLKGYTFSNEIQILNKTIDDENFIGFCYDSIPHGLGFSYKKNRFTYMGEFKNGKFDGLGRRNFPNDDVVDGTWKDGKMTDIGILFDNTKNSYTLGCFYEDQLINAYYQGEDFPHLLIKKIRNKIHMLSSIYIDKEYCFSKVRFSENTFLKLFFNFHKNHQKPFHLLKTNRSSAYFDDKNSKIIPEELFKDAKNDKNIEKILKSIKEINRLSPDNNKTVKINASQRDTHKIFKKIENFQFFHKENDKENVKKMKPFDKILYESSLSRLKLLGLEVILNEIEEIERNLEEEDEQEELL